MCTSLARVGRRRVCVHFDGAIAAVWVTDAAGCGGANLFVVLDGDANTQLEWPLMTACGVGRERGGKPVLAGSRHHGRTECGRG